MLKGTVTAANLIAEMKNEIDVSLPLLNDEKYIEWINNELFYIYTFAVRELGVNCYRAFNLGINMNRPNDDTSDFNTGFDPETGTSYESVNCTEDIDTITFEDIYKVFDGSGNEFARSTYGAVLCFGKRIYYFNNGKVYINETNNDGYYKILFYKRPKAIDKSNVSNYLIPLPDAFVDVIRAKIRCEAFMLAGNITMSNAWREQHRVLFDELKGWYEQRMPVYIK